MKESASDRKVRKNYHHSSHTMASIFVIRVAGTLFREVIESFFGIEKTEKKSFCINNRNFIFLIFP